MFRLKPGKKHVSGCPRLFVYAEDYLKAIEVVKDNQKYHTEDEVFDLMEIMQYDSPRIMVGW